MAKRYGEAMSDWENSQDEADWRKVLWQALFNNDVNWIEELLREGTSEGYDFYDFAQYSVVQEIMAKLKC